MDIYDEIDRRETEASEYKYGMIFIAQHCHLETHYFLIFILLQSC